MKASIFHALNVFSIIHFFTWTFFSVTFSKSLTLPVSLTFITMSIKSLTKIVRCLENSAATKIHDRIYKKISTFKSNDESYSYLIMSLE
jgi:uncharacterized membrane protein required for colicin V production